MTKKHFEALADELASVRPPQRTSRKNEFSMWSACVAAVADVCRSHNGHFDREKFVAACSDRKSYNE